MSESAPETSGGGGNVFTRKMGPLPLWGWMAVGLLLAVGFYLFSKNKSANSQTQSTTTNNTPGGVDSSLVPQFINQVYDQDTPPTAPNVTVNNTIPTPPSPTSPPPPTHSGGGNTGGSTSNTGGGGTAAPKTPANEVLTKGHVISPNPHKAIVGWTSSGVGASGATQLRVTLNGPGHKNQVRYIPATATTATFEGLEPGHTYVAEVDPIDARGQAVGGPNHITFITSK